MSLDAHRLSVEGTLQAQMHAAYPNIPIKFQNAKFVQPDTTWVALHLVDGKSHVTNLGRNRQIDRHVGLVQVDILVPELSGTKQASSLADWIGKIWRLQTVQLVDGAVVRYRTPEVATHGEQGGFFRMSVSVSYWRDEPPQ